MLPHLLHLSLCSQKFVYTCRCCSGVMSMTVIVSVLVADVNELLRTIWQYLCVNMMRLCSMQHWWPAGPGYYCGYIFLTVLVEDFL